MNPPWDSASGETVQGACPAFQPCAGARPVPGARGGAAQAGRLTSVRPSPGRGEGSACAAELVRVTGILPHCHWPSRTSRNSSCQ